MSPAASAELVNELFRLPGKLEQILQQTEPYEELARRVGNARDFLYLGRGIHFTH